MSTMLDAYDMQMLDYTNDLDIQMHPSSSDQWFHDESKMEEDGPQTTMKPENHSQTQKTDGHLLMKIEPFLRDKAEVTIEVDMESYETNVEYEMLDDEDRKASGTEFLDVDVYDASNAHSPSMLDPDALDLENHNLATLDNGDIAPVLTSYKDLPITSPHLQNEALEPHFFLSNGEGSLELLSEPEPSGFDSHKNTELDLPASDIGTVDGGVQEALLEDILDHHAENPQVEDQPFGGEVVVPSGDALSESIYPTATEASGQEDALYLQVQSSPLPETSEPAADPITPVNSSGDPHEISEGVYIDPPPPVLLSMAPAENFDFSFFNEATEWIQSDSSSSNVVLQQYPTLYYEPLFSVFEALRQDELAQSISNVVEAELILDAIDLELTIPEDNVYAREISLHDLNILHDALGFSGPLRMRLNFITPRFIVRYHALQDQITRTHLDQPNVPHAGKETAEEKNEESLVVPGKNQENEQVNENEPSKGQDHDNLLQNTIQDVFSVFATVDRQYDAQDDPNEEFDLQHPTDKDTPEELPLNPLVSSDQDVNNLHPTVHHLTTTTDLHSRSSEADSYSGDGKIISLDVVEAEWDHEPDDVEGEHFYEDSNHSSKVVPSIHTNEEQELKDMGQSYVHSEVTEQDDPANSWQDGDYDEVDHADPTFAEGEEPYTHKVESRFDEQESVLDIPEPENEGIGSKEDYEDLLELPTDPINFEAEDWDDDQDGEGELDVNWGLENEIPLSNSNHSSVTLSSKASKRSFDEVDEVGDEDGHTDGTLSSTSPGQKRSRTH